MWISRREFSIHLQENREDIAKLFQRFDDHNQTQMEQHRENQRLLWKIMLMAIGGLAMALWELVRPHLM